jgi:hypothetical protein
MKYSIKINLLILISLISYTNVYSQEKDYYTTTITVTDPLDSSGIEGATIKILGDDNSSQTFKTKSNGISQILLKKEVTYKIKVLAQEFLSAKGIQSYHGEAETKIHFVLKPQRNFCSFCPLITYSKNNYESPIMARDTSEKPFDFFLYILKTNPDIKVELTGYRDNDEDSLISFQRASFAVEKLLSMGIDSQRIKANDGLNNQKPIDKIKLSPENMDININHNRIISFELTGIID